MCKRLKKKESCLIMDTERNEKKNSYNLEKLGKYIKEIRTAQDWSTTELAKLSGLSVGLINQIENNTAKSPPKPSSLSLLAKTLKVSPLKLHKMAGFLPEDKVEKDEENNEWRVHFKSKLSDMGLKKKYVEEIISYIETVELKQELEIKKEKSDERG